MKPEEMARCVFEEATRLKATAAEFFHRREVKTEARVQGLAPDAYTFTEHASAGIRVFRGRRWGLRFTTASDPGSLRHAARETFALAAAFPEDPDTRLRESTGSSPSPLPPLDPEHDALDRAGRFEHALEIERGAFSVDRRVRSSRYVTFSDVRRETYLSNTRGLEAGYESGSFKISAMISAADGEAGQQLFGSESARRLSLLDPRGLGASIGKRLVVTLGGRPLPTGPRDVVIDRSQSPDLAGALAAALDGSQVHLGRSYLAGRVGGRVAGRAFTLFDDPLDPASSGSVPWDDEGVPAQRTSLVEEGVLEGFLYDVASASKAGCESTGNGFRPGADHPPGVLPTQLVIAPGAGSLETLLADVEEGLYVTGFMGRGIDPVTGAVSAAALGARIRGGRIAGPVAGVSLSGTLDGILAGLDGVGDDAVRQGPFRTPSLRIRNVMVAGS